MKRPWFILIGGLLLALAAYGVSYVTTSARMRTVGSNSAPELAWLKQEFQLSEAEFARIQKLHESYRSGCAERCRIIDAKNAVLENLLKQNATVTPEIEKAISEASQLRAECQTAMLQHFYAVSETMPPAQGKRYFEWVVSRTFGSDHQSMISAPAVSDAPAAATHEHHHE